MLIIIDEGKADMAAAKTPIKQRIIDADARASRWLADANEARERGDAQRAADCDAKGQYWRDRYNLLAGCGDRPAPKR